MQTTLMLDGVVHRGTWSQAFVDGVVFLFGRLHYQDSADRLRARMAIEGPHRIGETADYGLGCAPIGARPETNLGDLHDLASLENYVIEFTERDLEPGDLKRYIAETFMMFREVGGYERDRSFIDMTSFDDLDFGHGLAACAKWLGLFAPEVLDAVAFEIVTV